MWQKDSISTNNTETMHIIYIFKSMALEEHSKLNRMWRKNSINTNLVCC